MTNPSGWPEWLVPADVDLVSDDLIPPKPPVFPPLELECPACGVDIVGVGTPSELVLCIGCRAILVFEVDLTLMFDARDSSYAWCLLPGAAKLRRPTEDEERKALATPAVIAAIRAVAEHHARHGSPHPNIAPPDGGPREDPWGRS
jgi:hypothetical protein